MHSKHLNGTEALFTEKKLFRTTKNHWKIRGFRHFVQLTFGSETSKWIGRARKRTCESKSFFNEIRPYGRVKSTDGWVKSLRGEIPLRGVTDGFHFTRGRSPRISPKAPAFDFTAAGAAISLLFFSFYTVVFQAYFCSALSVIRLRGFADPNHRSNRFRAEIERFSS